jgi:hypothetical protein
MTLCVESCHFWSIPPQHTQRDTAVLHGTRPPSTARAPRARSGSDRWWHLSQIDATKTRLPRSPSLPQLAERGRYNDRADVMLSDMAPNLSGNKCGPSSHAPRARKHRDAAAPSRGPCSDAKSPRPGSRAPRLDLALSAPATGCWTRSGRSGSWSLRSRRRTTGSSRAATAPSRCVPLLRVRTAGVPRGGVRRVPGADAHKVRRGAHAQARCVAGADQRGIPGRRRLPQVCFRHLHAWSPWHIRQRARCLATHASRRMPAFAPSCALARRC